MSSNKKAHEPLLHIVKRNALPTYRQWIIRIGAVMHCRTRRGEYQSKFTTEISSVPFFHNCAFFWF